MSDDQPNDPTIHIEFGTKRDGIPEMGDAKPCGRDGCPAPDFELGFGLAGGGYGAYEFCSTCERIVSKTECGDDE